MSNLSNRKMKKASKNIKPKRRKWFLFSELIEKLRISFSFAVRLFFILSILALIISGLLLIKSAFFNPNTGRAGIFLTDATKIWFSGKEWDEGHECDPLFYSENGINFDSPLYLKFGNSPAQIDINDENYYDVVLDSNTDVTVVLKGYQEGEEILSTSYSDLRQIRIKAKGLALNHPTMLNYYTLGICGPSYGYWPNFWMIELPNSPPYSIETRFDMPVNDTLTFSLTDVTNFVDPVKTENVQSSLNSFENLQVEITRNRREYTLFESSPLKIYVLDFNDYPHLSPGTDFEFRYNNPETRLFSADGRSSEFIVLDPRGWFETSQGQKEFGNTSQNVDIKGFADRLKLDFLQSYVNGKYNISIIGNSDFAYLDGQSLFLSKWDEFSDETKGAYIGIVVSAIISIITLFFGKLKLVFTFLSEPFQSRSQIPRKLKKGELIIRLTSGKIIAGTYVKDVYLGNKAFVRIINPLEKEGELWKPMYEGEIEIPIERIELEYFHNL
jgi:hypothetical protein